MQSRWGYGSQKDVEDVFDNYRALDIPLDAIFLDIDYMDSYKEAWDTLMEQDSTALAIAGTLLSGAVIEIQRTEKNGPQRHVYYRLEADGRNKERCAVVRKEEGEWKIVSVTNAN